MTMFNDDKLMAADRKLAQLLLPPNVKGAIVITEKVIGWPDLDWNTVFTPRWTKDDAKCFELVRVHKVCINFYQDKVTANASQKDGASVRYSAHKTDDEATRYAIVCAVIKLLEKQT